MSGLDGRTGRLYPSLSARERAVLILQAAQAHEPADPRVRWTMPERQYPEFNGYLTQLRAVTTGLSPFVLLLRQEVRLAWSDLVTLSVLCGWGIDHVSLLRYIACVTDEPCTEAEYAQHLAEARAAELPIELAVDAVIGVRFPWTDADDVVARLGDEGALEAAVTAEIRGLVRTGALPGRGRGSRLVLSAGAFYDWLGEPVPVFAAWGRRYAVVPDEEVADLREPRERVRSRAAFGPRDPMEVLPEQAQSPEAVLDDADLSPHETLMRGLASKLHDDLGMLSATYAALELVLDEVAAGLDGHDPLDPDIRDLVTQIGVDLGKLREHAAGLVGPAEVGEPDAETLERLRGLVSTGETSGRR